MMPDLTEIMYMKKLDLQTCEMYKTAKQTLYRLYIDQDTYGSPNNINYNDLSFVISIIN